MVTGLKFKIDFTNYCAICQCIHEYEVDCNGKPIDWQALNRRAREWVKDPSHRGRTWMTGYIEKGDYDA